jgi:hypothetical protein
LNILDTLIDINSFYKKDSTELFKNISGEENDSEKENEGKSKDEKIFTNLLNPFERLQLLKSNNFNCYKLRLNKDPFHEDDIQPPKAV